MGPSRNGSNRRAFGCEVCGLTFSRATHLQRHGHTHTRGSLQEKQFECESCDKTFGRNDILLRHRRVIHGIHLVKIKKTSCQNCVRQKLKCSRSNPCDSCASRGIECTFECAPSPPDADVTTSHQQAPAETQQSFRSPNGAPISDHCSGNLTTNLNGVTRQSQNPIDFESLRYVESHLDGDQQQYHAAYPAAMEPRSCLLSASTKSPFEHLAQLQSTVTEPSGHDNISTFSGDVLGAEVSIDWDAFAPLGIDWLNDDQLLPIHNDTAQDMPPSLGQPMNGPRSSTFPEVDLLTNSNCPPLPPQVEDIRPLNEMQGRNCTYTNGPATVRQSQKSFSTSLDSTVTTCIRNALSGPYLPLQMDLLTLQHLESMISVFFAEFYPGLPVMHRATFDIRKCPTYLIAALACLGSTKQNCKKGLDDTSIMLAEICSQHLNDTYTLCASTFQSTDFAAAVLYHEVYCMGAVVPSLHESAENFREILVRILRRAGTYRSSGATDQRNWSVPDVNDLDHEDPAKLEAAWRQWRNAEMAKRLGWNVFEVDNSLSTLTAKRGTLNLQELPDHLPCDESLWEAHSAQAWASMASLSGFSLQGDLFRPRLREVLSEKLVTDNVSSWWKRCCAQAIVRLFWDLKEMDNSILSLFTPNSFSASQAQLRKYLFRALRRLHDSAARPSRPHDLIHVNITCLLYHHAVLYSRRELMELIMLLCQNGANLSKSELEMAQKRLQTILADDPVHARRLLYHAGSIIAICRECTANSPCEILRVFDAYAYVLAFIKYGSARHKTLQAGEETNRNLSGSSLSEVSGPKPKSIRIDHIPWKRTPAQYSALEHWIGENRGTPCLDGCHDLYEDGSYSKLKTAALRAIERLNVWDLSRRFHRTLVDLEQVR